MKNRIFFGMMALLAAASFLAACIAADYDGTAEVVPVSATRYSINVKTAKELGEGAPMEDMINTGIAAASPARLTAGASGTLSVRTDLIWGGGGPEDTWFVKSIEGSYNKDGSERTNVIFRPFSTGETNGWAFKMPRAELTIKVGFTQDPAVAASTLLSKLYASEGEISPAFNKNTKDYTITVPSGTPEFSISAQAENPYLTPVMLPSGGGGDNLLDKDLMAAGNYGHLSEGLNQYTISVTPTGEGEPTVYNIAVIRLPDLSLKEFKVKNETEGFELNLAPAAASPQDVYVPYTEGISVLAEANDSGADVNINPTGPFSDLTATSPVTVNVTVSKTLAGVAASLTRKTYVLELYYSVGVTFLSQLSASTGEISPQFVKTTKAYTITVPSGTTGFSISAQAEDAQLMPVMRPSAGGGDNLLGKDLIAAGNDGPLSEGLNKYTISVTPSEGGDPTVYNIDVILLPDLSLKELKVKKADFEKNLTPLDTQDVYLLYTEGITVVAKANDSSAIVVTHQEDISGLNASSPVTVSVKVSKDIPGVVDPDLTSKTYVLNLYWGPGPGVTPLASGGETGFIPHEDGSFYEVHVFNSNGALTFTDPAPASIVADYLIVAGGGGGGGGCWSVGGGGGGAGGLLYQTGQTLATNSPMAVTVGAGGAGSPGTNEEGSNGGNSSIGDIVVPGGGGGGKSYDGSLSSNGKNGGSGGGGGKGYNSNRGAGGSSTAAGDIKGSRGGAGGNNSTTAQAAGGGGGAGGEGGTPVTSAVGGAGGLPWTAGVAWIGTITNTTAFSRGGNGGNGVSCGNGADGMNYGDGGSGGGMYNDRKGGAGHSGIVVICFPRNGGTQE